MKLNFNQQAQQSPTQQAANNTLNINNLNNKLNQNNSINLKFTDGQTYNLDQLIAYKRRNNSTCPLIIQVRNSDTDDQKIIEKITKLILDDYGIEYTDFTYKNLVYKVPNFSEVFDNYFNRYYKYYYDKLNKSKVSGGTLILEDVIADIQKLHDGLYDQLIDSDSALTYANDENSYNKPMIEIEYGSQDDEEAGLLLYDGLKFVEDPLDHSKDNLSLYHKNEVFSSITVDDLFVNHGLKLGETNTTAFSGERGILLETSVQNHIDNQDSHGLDILRPKVLKNETDIASLQAETSRLDGVLTAHVSNALATYATKSELNDVNNKFNNYLLTSEITSTYATQQYVSDQINSLISSDTTFQENIDSISGELTTFEQSTSGNINRIDGLLTEYNSRISTNTGRLDSQLNSINTNTGNIATNTNAIGVINNTLTEHNGRITANNTSITNINTEITGIKASISSNTTNISGNTNAIDAIDTRIDNIENILPTSNEITVNTLADRQFVNSSIQNMAAFYVSNNGDPFASYSELIGAELSNLYIGGEQCINGKQPGHNDYCIVLADENHIDEFGRGQTTRYIYTGYNNEEYDIYKWEFQYVINNTRLTNDQVNAINSGITSNKLSKITTDITTIDGLLSSHRNNIDNPHSVTKTQVGLGNVINTGDTPNRIQDSNLKFTAGGAYSLEQDFSNKIGDIGQQSVKNVLDTKVDNTTTINNHRLNENINLSATDVGLGNVINTGDSPTPTENGITKFTTGGAYTLQQTFNNQLSLVNNKFNNYTTTDNLATVLELDLYAKSSDVGRDYATKAEVANDLSEYSKTSTIVDTYATKTAVDNKFNNYSTTAEIGNTYATKTSVSDLSAYAESTYATKTGVAADKSELSGNITTLRNDVADTYATKASLASNINTVNSNIGAIAEKISENASSENKLTDTAYVHNYVNNSIQNMAAFYVYYTEIDNQKMPFPSHAALLSSQSVYIDGVQRNPGHNDYCIVLVDEDHLDSLDHGQTTRYIYTGSTDEAYDSSKWAFQYAINNTGLNNSQIEAVNSGINSTLVSNINSHLSNNDAHGLDTVRQRITTNETDILELQTQANAFESSLNTHTETAANTYATISSLTADKAELAGSISDLSSYAALTYATKDELSGELENYSTSNEIASTYATTQDLADEVSNLNTDISTLRADMLRNDNTNDLYIRNVSNNLSSQITTLQTNIENDISGINNTLTTHTNSISDVSSSLSTLTTRVGEDETANDTDHTAYESLLAGHTSDISRIDSAITSINNSVSTNSSNISSLTTTVSGNTSDISTNRTNISTINSKIPSQASDQNQLADKAFVNSSIENLAAFYVSKLGVPFNTVAELTSSTVSGIYVGGEQNKDPGKNDYCIVLHDENHLDNLNNAQTTRYIYTGSNTSHYDPTKWEFQYVINSSGFTSAQIAAIDSNITSELVGDIQTHLSNNDAHGLDTVKSTLSTAVSNISTINGTTIPAITNRLDTAEGNISNITGTTIPGITTRLGTAESNITTITGTTIPNINSTISNMQSAITSNQTNITALDGRCDTLNAKFADYTETNDLETVLNLDSYATKTYVGNELSAYTPTNNLESTLQLNTYLKSATASTTYATKSEVSNQFNNYSTTSVIASTYATKNELNSYETSAHASQTYATKQSLTSYLSFTSPQQLTAEQRAQALANLGISLPDEGGY